MTRLWLLLKFLHLNTFRIQVLILLLPATPPPPSLHKTTMLSFSSTLPTTSQTPLPTTHSALLSQLPLSHSHHEHHRFCTTPPYLLHQSRSRRHYHHHHPPAIRNRICAIDAAQPYDSETKLSNRFSQSSKLKIAIIGFGNFGQFLAKAFIRQGHAVLANSRSDYSSIAQSLGVSFYSDPHDLCEQHPDVIVFSTAIIHTEKVLKSLPIQSLKRNTLFVDVLSVKEFPKNIFLQNLPNHFDILCTHPMFGPESGKDSWVELPFVYDKVRIGHQKCREVRVANFLKIFEKEGCRMVEMSCTEHDKYAAGSQFITHTMGRILEKLRLETTPINTKGYERLLDLVENTGSDSFDLYYGLFMYNKNAMEELERLDLAFESLKKELFGHLHEVLRKQLFGKVEVGVEGPVLLKLPKNGIALPAPKSETIEISNN